MLVQTCGLLVLLNPSLAENMQMFLAAKTKEEDMVATHALHLCTRSLKMQKTVKGLYPSFTQVKTVSTLYSPHIASLRMGKILIPTGGSKPTKLHHTRKLVLGRPCSQKNARKCKTANVHTRNRPKYHPNQEKGGTHSGVRFKGASNALTRTSSQA